jgi:hypothetical protein
MADRAIKKLVEKKLKELKAAGASQEVQDAARKWLEAMSEFKKTK